MTQVRLAVLLTCFNRKEKTLSCLQRLYASNQSLSVPLELTVYLTDDGSTDGTSETIKREFPEVVLLKGNGNLYWAGGMRNSWREALKTKHDAFLLLNDDTNVNSSFLSVLLETHQYALNEYQQPGVYIGSTQDAQTGQLSYGGAKLTNAFWFRYQFVEPKDHPQECDLGNANIMWVDQQVVAQIGPLAEGYIHGVADYDYTLRAKKAGIPVLIAPGFLGTCTDDHQWAYKGFEDLSLRQRWAKLHQPTGLDLKSNLLLQWRFFPQRVPFVVASALLKLLWPQLYVKRFKIA